MHDTLYGETHEDQYIKTEQKETGDNDKKADERQIHRRDADTLHDVSFHNHEANGYGTHHKFGHAVQSNLATLQKCVRVFNAS